MLQKNLKRLTTRLKLIKKCIDGLHVVFNTSYMICLTKAEIDYLDKTEMIKISDDCHIQGFYFSGKFIKKRILLIEKSKFNESYMENIKSKQLRKKAELYLNKWVQKAIKKLNYNYALVNKNSSKDLVNTIENCLTLNDKNIIKKTRNMGKSQKHSEWVDYFETLSNESSKIPETKPNKNKNKKAKNNYVVDDNYIKNEINLCFTQNGIVEIGEISSQVSKGDEDIYNDYETKESIEQKDTPTPKVEQSFPEAKCLSCGCNPFIKPDLQKYMDNATTFLQYGYVRKNEETQTENIEIDQTLSDNLFTEKEDAQTQTAIEVKVIQKVSKILSELDPDGDLGCPSDKRTNELETIYDEINSIIKKAKKSNSNLLIKTPDVHYIAFDSFKLLTDEEQKDILSHYKGHAVLLKQIVKLRNMGLTESTENKFIEVMNKDQMLVGSLMMLIDSIKTRIKSLPAEDYPEIQCTMLEKAETTVENTPLEGNSSSLSLNDDLIDSLMSSLDFS